MGGCDQFKGIGALAFPIGGAKVLALREGTTRGGYRACHRQFSSSVLG